MRHEADALGYYRVGWRKSTLLPGIAELRSEADAAEALRLARRALLESPAGREPVLERLLRDYIDRCGIVRDHARARTPGWERLRDSLARAMDWTDTGFAGYRRSV